jgi:hypothetical protein
MQVMQRFAAAGSGLRQPCALIPAFSNSSFCNKSHPRQVVCPQSLGRIKALFRLLEPINPHTRKPHISRGSLYQNVPAPHRLQCWKRPFLVPETLQTLPYTSWLHATRININISESWWQKYLRSSKKFVHASNQSLPPRAFFILSLNGRTSVIAWSYFNILSSPFILSRCLS